MDSFSSQREEWNGSDPAAGPSIASQGPKAEDPARIEEGAEKIQRLDTWNLDGKDE